MHLLLRCRPFSRRAATSIEYALIASLVSVFIIGGVTAVSSAMMSGPYATFPTIASALGGP
jgi:Flp pilus assembly pilin Flp